MFGAEEAQIMAYQKERKEKQQYLRQYIQDYGYDPADFAQYMEWQRGKWLEPCFIDGFVDDGTNIDNWTLEDLTQCVKDYYAWIE